ncbi:Rho guanine nucleotide exchange factor, putative, partial [Entamoeba histolytica HM-3:IMSS]
MEILNKPMEDSYVKFKTSSRGKLVTNGDIIKMVIKGLGHNSDQSGATVEEFFKQIDSRTMTDENKKHFKRV